MHCRTVLLREGELKKYTKIKLIGHQEIECERVRAAAFMCMCTRPIRG